MKKNFYNFENTETIFGACKMAQENKMLVLIEGDSGYGKSFAFEYYKKKNSNVIIDELKPGDRARSPWRRILGKLTFRDTKRYIGSFEFIINQLVGRLNSTENPNLIILDEAGFLSYATLRHFRSLVDRTRKSTGFVISGPDYFIENIKQWIEDKVPGMKELDTRIDVYVKLKPPTYQEKAFVCKNEGIIEPGKIRQIASRVDNFRDLFREIEFYHKGIEGRREWEWSKSISSLADIKFSK